MFTVVDYTVVSSDVKYKVFDLIGSNLQTH